MSRGSLLFFVLSIGVIGGLVLYMIIDQFNSLEPSDVIDIVAVLVNIILGVVIVFVIQKRLSDDRGVKDYLIQEVGEIKTQYVKFINKLHQNPQSRTYIIEWFKSISMRIDQLEHFINNEFKIENPPALTVLSRELHTLLTASVEFNNNFRNDYSPSTAMKNALADCFKNLKYGFTSLVLKINRA